MVNLGFFIGDLYFKNPVLTASGTFGNASEFDDFLNVSDLGGVILKGTTMEPREGNPYPRMAETPSGMLNSVGLQNKGIDYFEKVIYPRILNYDTNIIVNINGSYIEDYIILAERINKLEKIPAIELNMSCANVKMGGMAVDITGMRPALSTITGGLSGPAINPVALRMVWQVANAVKIPVIGMGGIMTAADALEFILAGASAIQVGTASFIDPRSSINILKGIENYLVEKGYSDIREIVGFINRTKVQS